MRGQRIRRVALFVAALIILPLSLLVGWGLLFAWRPLHYYDLDPEAVALPMRPMNNAEYAEVIGDHPRPFIVRIENVGEAGGGVLLYGATHTRDPDNPQIAEIERLWADFDPTVALCESDLGILFPGFIDPIETFGEAGALHALARRHDAPTYTWEPRPNVLARALVEQGFTKEQVSLSLVLRPAFSSRRFGPHANAEALVADTFRERVSLPAISGALRSVDDIDAAWANHFPEGPDWRDVSDEYALPGFLARIDANLPRDRHFARVVIDLVRKGERVFAVAGSSHAVKLERTLRAALEAP